MATGINATINKIVDDASHKWHSAYNEAIDAIKISCTCDIDTPEVDPSERSEESQGCITHIAIRRRPWCPEFCRKYELVAYLGKGSYGVAFAGRTIVEPYEHVAVKFVNPDRITEQSGDMYQRIRDGKTLMTELFPHLLFRDHPAHMQVIETYPHYPYFIIVMPLFAANSAQVSSLGKLKFRPDLARMVRITTGDGHSIQPSDPLSEGRLGGSGKGEPPELGICKVASMLLSALQSAKERGCTHNDIALRNILVNEKWETKLIDWGALRIHPEDTDWVQFTHGQTEHENELRDPLWGCSGFAFLEKKVYNPEHYWGAERYWRLRDDMRRVDLYRMSCLIFWFLNGYIAYCSPHDVTAFEVGKNARDARAVEARHGPLQMVSFMSQDSVDALAAMLEKDATKRDRTEDLATLPWFSGFYVDVGLPPRVVKPKGNLTSPTSNDPRYEGRCSKAHPHRVNIRPRGHYRKINHTLLISEPTRATVSGQDIYRPANRPENRWVLARLLNAHNLSLFECFAIYLTKTARDIMEAALLTLEQTLSCEGRGERQSIYNLIDAKCREAEGNFSLKDRLSFGNPRPSIPAIARLLADTFGLQAIVVIGYESLEEELNEQAKLSFEVHGMEVDRSDLQIHIYHEIDAHNFRLIKISDGVNRGFWEHRREENINKACANPWPDQRRSLEQLHQATNGESSRQRLDRYWAWQNVTFEDPRKRTTGTAAGRGGISRAPAQPQPSAIQGPRRVGGAVRWQPSEGQEPSRLGGSQEQWRLRMDREGAGLEVARGQVQAPDQRRGRGLSAAFGRLPSSTERQPRPSRAHRVWRPFSPAKIKEIQEAQEKAPERPQSGHLDASGVVRWLDSNIVVDAPSPEEAQEKQEERVRQAEAERRRQLFVADPISERDQFDIVEDPEEGERGGEEEEEEAQEQQEAGVGQVVAEGHAEVEEHQPNPLPQPHANTAPQQQVNDDEDEGTQPPRKRSRHRV